MQCPLLGVVVFLYVFCCCCCSFVGVIRTCRELIHSKCGGPERFNPVDALDIRVQCVNSNAYFEWKLTGKYPVSHVNLEYTCINVSSGHHHILPGYPDVFISYSRLIESNKPYIISNLTITKDIYCTFGGCVYIKDEDCLQMNLDVKNCSYTENKENNSEHLSSLFVSTTHWTSSHVLNVPTSTIMSTSLPTSSWYFSGVSAVISSVAMPSVTTLSIPQELSLHTFAKIAIVTVGVLVVIVTVVILVICLVLKDHIKRTWTVTSSDIKTNKQQFGINSLFYLDNISTTGSVMTIVQSLNVTSLQSPLQLDDNKLELDLEEIENFQEDLIFVEDLDDDISNIKEVDSDTQSERLGCAPYDNQQLPSTIQSISTSFNDQQGTSRGFQETNLNSNAGCFYEDKLNGTVGLSETKHSPSTLTNNGYMYEATPTCSTAITTKSPCTVSSNDGYVYETTPTYSTSDCTNMVSSNDGYIYKTTPTYSTSDCTNIVSNNNGYLYETTPTFLTSTNNNTVNNNDECVRDAMNTYSTSPINDTNNINTYSTSPINDTNTIVSYNDGYLYEATTTKSTSAIAHSEDILDQILSNADDIYSENTTSGDIVPSQFISDGYIDEQTTTSFTDNSHVTSNDQAMINGYIPYQDTLPAVSMRNINHINTPTSLISCSNGYVTNTTLTFSALPTLADLSFSCYNVSMSTDPTTYLSSHIPSSTNNYIRSDNIV